MQNYKIDGDLKKNNFFLFINDVLVDETTKEYASFLHNTVYELTTQKELLNKCENIIQICNLILNTLSIYENIFDLQFVCYIILKRIYFTFPQFRKNFEDVMVLNLCNLCEMKESVYFDILNLFII